MLAILMRTNHSTPTINCEKAETLTPKLLFERGERTYEDHCCLLLTQQRHTNSEVILRIRHQH